MLRAFAMALLATTMSVELAQRLLPFLLEWRGRTGTG